MFAKVTMKLKSQTL